MAKNSKIVEKSSHRILLRKLIKRMKDDRA
jgi:hypothetical protein